MAWVTPGNLHVTLKFLGQVDEARVPAVAGALAAAALGHRVFDVVVRGLGAFPTPVRPRVLWAGLEGDAGRLRALAESVDAACAGLEFPPETRAFAPHVTLGRAREPRRQPALAAALAGPADFGRVRVDRVALMRSELSPGGSRYTELAALPLAVE